LCISSQKITEPEIKAILEDIYVSFDNYYKYDFWFTGMPYKYYPEEIDDGTVYWIYKITTKYGGDTDRIYRYNVSIFKPEPLFPFNRWDYVKIERHKRYDEPWEVVFEEEYDS